MDDKAKKRQEESARNFWEHVRPLLEKKLNIQVLPLELLPDNKLVEAFDNAGIDAFYVKDGQLRGLASRVRSKAFQDIGFKGDGLFTIRPGEAERWHKAVNNPLDHVFFPHLYIESFLDKESKQIIWSYAMQTMHIANYIYANEGDKNKIRIKKVHNPTRDIIIIPIETFRKEYGVEDLKS